MTNASCGGHSTPLARITQPLEQFMATEAAGGIVLMVAALTAIAWANSPWSDVYQDMLHAHIHVDLGFYAVDESVHYWINDVAMVIFFFLMGLEIKRELVLGELTSMRRAMAPLAAAAGGMIVPAAIFLLLVSGNEARVGWGVPIATDIAFALGVAVLLGPRVSTGLKVLLLALAIFDDLGAVAVIAIFYAEGVALGALAVAFALLGLTYALNRLGVRHIPIYVLVGIGIWVAVRESGVHPTTVGVALGLLTPWRPWSRPDQFVAEAREILHEVESESYAPDAADGRHHHNAAVARLRRLNTTSIAPLDRLEHELNPWVAFLIIPVFALANAGVDLRGDTLATAFSESLTWGVAVGLFVGKPLGVLLGTMVAVRLGAELPSGVSWSGVLGVGALAGIGFTVALFVAELAYPSDALLTQAKVGVFVGSLASGALGYALLRRSGRVTSPAGV